MHFKDEPLYCHHIITSYSLKYKLRINKIQRIDSVLICASVFFCEIEIWPSALRLEPSGSIIH